MSNTPQTDANLSADGMWVPAFVVRQMERDHAAQLAERDQQIITFANQADQLDMLHRKAIAKIEEMREEQKKNAIGQEIDGEALASLNSALSKAREERDALQVQIERWRQSYGRNPHE